MELKKEFIIFCKQKKYEFACGYDWCDCNDFTEFVNIKVDGKWHTLYCLNSGGYRFDKTNIETLEQIKELLNG